jgi:hypothetical protein
MNKLRPQQAEWGTNMEIRQIIRDRYRIERE